MSTVVKAEGEIVQKIRSCPAGLKEKEQSEILRFEI